MDLIHEQVSSRVVVGRGKPWHGLVIVKPFIPGLFLENRQSAVLSFEITPDGLSIHKVRSSASSPLSKKSEPIEENPTIYQSN